MYPYVFNINFCLFLSKPIFQAFQRFALFISLFNILRKIRTKFLPNNYFANLFNFFLASLIENLFI